MGTRVPKRYKVGKLAGSDARAPASRPRSKRAAELTSTTKVKETPRTTPPKRDTTQKETVPVTAEAPEPEEPSREAFMTSKAPEPLPKRTQRKRENLHINRSNSTVVEETLRHDISEEEEEAEIEASGEPIITADEITDDVVDFRMIIYSEEILVVSPKILEGPNLGLLPP